MRGLRAFAFRIAGQFRQRSADRDISAELESHLDLHIADNMRAGMSPEKARRQALVALGGLEPTKERYRDLARWRLVEELARDVVVAFRMLTRDRGFALTATLVLGIGLAVTNTFFILMNAVVLRGLPIDEPDRVVMIRARDTADRNLGMSYDDYLDMRMGATSVSGLGAFTWASMTVGDDAHASERFRGSYVSSNVFRLIGERPIAGRDFQPQDDEPGAPVVAILGRSVWESRYGANPAVVGSTLRVNGVPATIVGIMPDRSKFFDNTEVWQPLVVMPRLLQPSRGSRQLDVIGRLTPGASLGDARGEFQSRWSELSRRFPATNSNLRLVVMPIENQYVGDWKNPAWLAFIAAGLLILAVACANVANLHVMRGTHRVREIAVRTSLGATRPRIVRQLLAESVVLALAGGVVGLTLSLLAARLLWVATPEGTLPHWMHFTMDPPMFAVLAAMCLGSAIVFGLVPAVQVSKSHLNPALNSGTRGSSHSAPSRWLTSMLLVAQFAIALGALVSISAAAREVAVSNGVADSDARGLLTMSIAVPGGRYPTPELRNAFYERLRREFSSVEGVTHVAFASNLPLGGAATRALILEQHEANATAARPMVRSVSVGPGYFDTLGVALVRGREFTEQDGAAQPMPVVINQRFVDLHLSGSEPIGKPITVVVDSTPRRFTVIGVATSIRQRPAPEIDPVVYFPLRGTAPSQMSIVVRGPGNHEAVAKSLRNVMQSIDPDVPLYRMMTLEASIHEMNWNARVSNIMASAASLLAVLLSAIGLFALTAHAVAWMTPEIGVRTALGASPHHVLQRVLRRAAIQLALGIAAGVAFALAWNRIFSGGQSPSNVSPIDFAIAAGTLTLVSVAACLVPAIRALHVDPITALRYE